MLACLVDLCDQLRHCRSFGMSDLHQAAPERIFERDAGLVSINHMARLIIADFMVPPCWLELAHPLLDRKTLRQRNDARAAMAIAARALHVTQRHTNGSLRVPRLNAQVQVHHSAATVAVDNEPVMF